MIALETPPDPIKFVNPYRDEDLLTVYTPSPDMLIQEIVFWRNWRRKTSQGETVWEVASNLSAALRNGVNYRADLEEAYAQSPNMKLLYQEGLKGWSREVMVAVTRSHLGRLLVDGIAEYKGSDHIAIFDFTAEPGKGGFHTKKDYLEQNIGMQWPAKSQSLWYDTESVYLQVSRPARPSQLTVEAYPFRGSDFATISPFLKTSVWMGEEQA